MSVVNRMRREPVTPSEDLISPLWRGSREVTMRTKDWQRVILHYGADFLFMKAGAGYRLKGRSLGAGLYSVSLVPAEDV